MISFPGSIFYLHGINKRNRFIKVSLSKNKMVDTGIRLDLDYAIHTALDFILSKQVPKEVASEEFVTQLLQRLAEREARLSPEERVEYLRNCGQLVKIFERDRYLNMQTLETYREKVPIAGTLADAVYEIAPELRPNTSPTG